MKKIIPEKLKKGDEIRVIAPSRNMAILSEETISIAKERFEKLGFKLTFGKNVMKQENDVFMCGSIKERVDDLHEAFIDNNVKAIITVIGGFNVNQILDSIDYDLIKKNPKIICGFSDITALLDAIYKKTGLVTYYGPHFSSFGMKKGFEYTQDYFCKMLVENKLISIDDSCEWSDDLWFINQDKREFISNEGRVVLNKGKAHGTIIGGNLCTFNLLQGTEYMPTDNDIILFIEDDALVGGEFTREFDRDLQSLLHCLKGKNIKGVVVGRAQKDSEMNLNKWKYIFDKKELKDIPIIINMDFGHTTPIFTFPIGGECTIDNDKVTIQD